MKNRRNQSFNFYVRRGERKEKKSFLLLNLFRSSPPFYKKLQIYGGGYKKLFFLLSRVTGTVKFDWSANFDPLKESVLNLTFTKEKKDGKILYC